MPGRRRLVLTYYPVKTPADVRPFTMPRSQGPWSVSRDGLASGLGGNRRRTLGLDRDRDPAVADGEDDGVGPIRRRELVRDRPHVIANGLLADLEDLTDRAIRPSTSDVGKHFELACGQRASRWIAALLGPSSARWILGTGTRQGQLQTWRRATGSRHTLRLHGHRRSRHAHRRARGTGDVQCALRKASEQPAALGC